MQLLLRKTATLDGPLWAATLSLPIDGRLRPPATSLRALLRSLMWPPPRDGNPVGPADGRVVEAVDKLASAHVDDRHAASARYSAIVGGIHIAAIGGHHPQISERHPVERKDDRAERFEID